jgi:succinoglycan biosynthesis transport protein ExoP
MPSARHEPARMREPRRPVRADDASTAVGGRLIETIMMNQPTTIRFLAGADPSALRVFLRLLWRHKFLIALPTIVVAAAALVFTLQQEEKYTASASLIFRDSGPAAQPLVSEDPEREAATNVRLLQGDLVERRVARALGGSIGGTVSVVAEGDSNVITVKATATDPERAARIANTYAKEFTEFRRETARRELREEQRETRGELAALDNIPPGTADELAIQRERFALQRRLAQLAVATPGAEAIRRVGLARPPSSSSSPNPVRNTLLGALVGLILGLVLAGARDRLDRRIRDPQELESVFERPIIGRIPKSRALAKRRRGAKALPPAEAEAFHSLRANLQYFGADGRPRSVLVTSAEPREGKTTIAWNLACAASSPGSKVMLIEGDLRRPTLARTLGADDAPGLSEFLLGEASFDEVVREVDVASFDNGMGTPRTVSLILAGSPPANPLDLLDSERMRELLRTLSETYDLVVIDTPPTSTTADAIPLLSQVGGVLVVGRLAKSGYDSASELSELLTRLEAPTFGVVVNSDQSRSYY